MKKSTRLARLVIFLILLIAASGFGQFKATENFKATNGFKISSPPKFTANYSSAGGDMTWTVNGQPGSVIYFDWGDGSVTEHTLDGTNQDIVHTYAQGTYRIKLYGALSDMDGRWQCNDGELEGDVADFPTGAGYYLFYDTSIFGDVADLPAGASHYWFYNTSIFGDIADLPTGAGYYYFHNTSIFGDVADLPTGADHYYFHNTSIFGDVADLPTGADHYYFHNTSIFGDIADLPTGAGRYYFHNTSISDYVSGFTGLGDNYNLKIQDNSWPQSSVDAFLIDLDASGDTGGTLDISGNNAARSSASDAAITSLEGKGWDITVNE